MSAEPLDSPALGEYTTKLDLYHALAEWVSGWFDGQEKPLGSADPILWPRVPIEAIQFDLNVEAVKEPTRIRCIVVPSSSRSSPDTVPGKLFNETECSVQWYVSASARARDVQMGNALDTAMRVSGLLAALLRSPESRFQMRQCGAVIHNVRDPVAIPADAGEFLQLVQHSLRMQFRISV